MKKLLFIGLISASLVLGGCFKQEKIPEAQKVIQGSVQSWVVQVGSVEAPKAIEMNSWVIEQVSTGSISKSWTENESWTTNQISFSDSQIKDMLAKIDENTKNQQEQVKSSTGVLIQGDFRAELLSGKSGTNEKIKIYAFWKEIIISLPQDFIARNIEVLKLYENGTCNTDNYDLPKCAKFTSNLSKFYNNWTYLQYNIFGYEGSQTIFLDTRTGETLYEASLAQDCQANNHYIACVIGYDGGTIHITNLKNKSNNLIWEESDADFLVGWWQGTEYFVDNNYLYYKYIYSNPDSNDFTERVILRIYSLDNLKKIFTQEIK